MTRKSNKKNKGQNNAGPAKTASPNGVDPAPPVPPSPSPEPTNGASTSQNTSMDNSEPPPLETPPEAETNPEKFKEQGNEEFKAKRYKKAAELYSKAIELQPSEPNYWNNRAAAYMAQNLFMSALPDAQTAATLQSSSPQPKTLLRLARCHLALGNVAGTLSTLRTCLDLEPSNATALQMTKNAKKLDEHLSTFKDAKENKDWGVARLALDQCFRDCEGGGSEEWKKWRIEMEIVKKRWDSASELATEALRLSPQSPDLMQLRALLLFLTARLPQAISHAQSCLRLDQENVPARKLLRRIREVERLKEEGNAAFKIGKLTDAISKYGECLDAIGEKEEEGGGGPLRGTLLSNRATALLKLGKANEALEDTNACLLISPGSFKALRTQARCHMALEDYESAVQSFQQALELNAVSISQEDEQSLKKELQKAEVFLKRSKAKDYYKILGLPKDCDEVDIKKAYRRESLLHHPDKGGDEEKFKLVVEAHAVLSDPRRRQRYDAGMDEDGQTDGSGMGGMGGMGGMDMNDILAAMAAQGGGFSFGGGGGPFGGGGGRGHSHSFGFGQ